jgi:Protein of unknown function (DUF2971)
VTLPKIEAYLAQTPPPVLYHYTSISGLQGILASRSLHATAVHYLNDSEEFRRALGQARSYLKETAESYSASQSENDLYYGAFLTILQQSMQRIMDLNVCVFSFSEEADLLSQWRAYSPPDSGYCLGFRSTDLRATLHALGHRLGPCTYGADQQQELVWEAVEAAISPYRDQPPTMSSADLAQSVVPALFNSLLNIAPFVKHPLFEAEKEWRIVTRPIPDGEMVFRIGRLMLMPYTSIALASGASVFPLAKIVIGPTPHPSLAERAVRGLLVPLGLHDTTEIALSEVPYRHL